MQGGEAVRVEGELGRCSIKTSDRKTSDSTLEVAEYLKQKLNEPTSQTVQEEEEQIDEEVFNDLSSGVYQLSRRSEREEDEGEDRREYYSQQVRVQGTGVEEERKGDSNIQGKGGFQGIDQERYEEIGMEEQRKEEKVQSSELQQRQTGNQNTEMEFMYPSLMEEQQQQQKPAISQQKVDTIKKSSYQFVEEEEIDSDSFQKINQQKPTTNNDNAKVVDNQQIQQKPKAVVTDYDLLEMYKQQENKAIEKPKSSRTEQMIMEQFSRQRKVIVQSDLEPRLKIIGYQKQYFFKIQTQVYQIQFSSPHKNYVFCRKFADFVLLDRLVKLQSPGYIIYPLPQNTLQFFKKIQLSVGSQLEKVMMIEKRLLELERYLNYLQNHKVLGTGHIFQAFISQSSQNFIRQMNQFQQALEHEQQSFVSTRIRQNYKSIKNFVWSGLSYFSNYIPSHSISESDSTLMVQIRKKSQLLMQTCSQIQIQLQRSKLVTGNLKVKAQKLIEIYQYNINLKPIESSIDSVLRLSTKITSSRNAYEHHKTWIEDQIIARVNYYVAIFQQVSQHLRYRSSLLRWMQALEEGEAKLGASIAERVEEFDVRFGADWQVLRVRFQEEYGEMMQQFSRRWVGHCGQMAKIWK